MDIDLTGACTMRKRASAPYLVVLSLAFAMSVLPAAAATRLASGTYREVSSRNGRVLAIGNELVLANDGDGRHRFSLNAIRPSDDDSGYIDGTLAHQAGQTWASNRRGARCRLAITPLAHDMLTVAQDVRFGDCGFGYGVTATGTYVRTRATGKLGPWNGP